MSLFSKEEQQPKQNQHRITAKTRIPVSKSPGLQFDGAELFAGWLFSVRLGIGASVPFSRESVTMGGDTFTLRQPAVTFTLGLVLGRFGDYNGH